MLGESRQFVPDNKSGTSCSRSELHKAGIYNVRLFEYENGTMEIRTYSDCVGTRPNKVYDEMMRKKQNEVRRKKYQVKECTIYNPFLDEEMGLYDLDEMEIDAKRKAHSAYNSYSRTIQQIYNVSRQCEWKWFVTLTFAPDVVDRYDYRACMAKARKWFNNLRSRALTNMQYLFVGEEHEKGGWHIHGLLARCDGLPLIDSGHVYVDGRIIYNLSGWRFGFSTAVEVADTHAISGYITKYITKSMVARTDGLRRYYKSNNIPEVKTSEFLVQGDEKKTFVEMLVDSLGVEKTYEKNVGGYTGVKYQYYERKTE